MKFSSRILAALVVASSAPAAFGQSRLQIIHSSDNESSFQDPNTLEEKVINYSALVNGLQQLASNEGIPSLHLTAGDHTIPGPFYLASSEVEQYGQNGLADIAIYNAFPNAANGIGNHEFDGGIDDFAHMVSAANYPFIAVNLDFTNVELMEGTPALTIGPDAGPCADVLGQVVKSCHVPAGDLTVGLIGRAPADFFNVVAADAVPGLDFVGGRDEGDQPIESAVPMVLEQVDLLTAAGASIIVLLDHAQDFTGDPLSAEALRGVDIIVAAGSSGFLAGEENGPFNFLREGEMGDANYPLVRTDSEGKTVLVVNSDQLYAYVGNLIVDFDENGDVVGYDMERSGPIATTQDAIDLLATELGVDTLEPIPEVREVLDLLQATPSITSSFEVIGSTEFELNGERVFVRGRETNLGRLAADSSLWEGNRYAAANSLPAIDVALKNGGGIRDTIVGPNVIRLTIEAALAFDNKLAIVELTGGQLLATMENSVSRVPAADGRFPQIAGMMMEFITTVDGVQGAATLDTPTRVKSLVITRADGSTDVLVEDFAAVGDLSRTFVMATNSFLTGGGDDYASLAAGTTLGETELGEQDILEDYIVTELGGSVDIMDPPPMPRIVAVPGPSRLQIIHSSDNESSFQDPNTLEEKVINYSALVNGLQQLASNEGIPSLHLTAGDHTIPGPFYLASSEVEQYGQNGLADIAIYNAFPNAANGIGNHEFDGGIDDFAHMVSAANYPFIAVNLDFTNVELMEGTPALTIGPDAGPCADVLGQVVKSCHVPAGDLTVGLIGRAPADFFNVVAADAVPGLDFVGGRDEGDQPIESAVPMVLEQVDLLTAAGASIIVLLDHAQDFTGDPLSAEALRGVDIIVAAGSSGFLAGEENGPFNFLREGEMGDANYPLVRTDSEGKTVLVVNSDQLYAYVGNLIVDFDENGDVVGYDMERSGPIATTQDAIDLLAAELGVDTLEPIPEVREVLDLLQATPSITSSFEVIGSTEFELNGERVFVRGRETNLGRLAADSSLWEGNRYAAANSLPAIDVALKNGGGIRDTIVGPNVIRLTIEAALAFDNKLAIVELTGGQLLATMENSVSRVPAADGRFPQIAGMMMEYITTVDGVQGAATLDTPTRVKSLVITKADGSTDVLVEDFAAVGDLSRTFVMATNSFLTGGGDDYASLAAGTTLGETELGEQDILEDYIVTELGGSVDIMDPPPMPRIVADPMDTDAPVPAPSDAPVVAPTAAPVDVPSDAPVPAPTEDESAAIRIISSLWALFAFLFVL